MTYCLGLFLICLILCIYVTGSPTAAPGSQEAVLYEHGVRIYGQAGLPRAFLSAVFSAVYPSLLRFVTPGQMMGCSYLAFSILLLIFSNTSSRLWAQIVVVLMAFPMAATFTLPVGVTVENSDKSNRGRYLGALNCFAVIPQLIDTLYVLYLV